MKQLVENPEYLISLQQEVTRMFEEAEASNRKPEIYNALKVIIEQRITEGTFRARFDEINDLIISMAQLDFSKSLDLGDRKDLFSYVASGLNLLSEELGAKVVSNTFVQTLVDKNTNPVVLIDKSGKIRFLNKAATSFLNFSVEEILHRDIHTLLDKDFCSTFSECWDERVVNIDIQNKAAQLIPIVLTASPINNDENTIDGFMLEFRPCN